MAEVEFRRATPDMAPMLAAVMREADREEILALGLDPVSVISRALRASGSTARLFYFNKALAGAWGIVPLSMVSSHVSPWVLTTPVVDRHKKTFFKASCRIIEHLRARYATMENHIDVRYEASLRWARRIGFRIEDPQPMGLRGAAFCRVVMGD